jgi:hypothetical protein
VSVTDRGMDSKRASRVERVKGSEYISASVGLF